MQQPGFHVISFIDYTANGLEEALINRARHPFTNGAIYYQRLVKTTVTVERASDERVSRSCEMIKTDAKHVARISDGSLKRSLLNISCMLLSCFFIHVNKTVLHTREIYSVEVARVQVIL